MQSPGFALSLSLVVAVAACAEPPVEDDVDVDVRAERLGPTECRLAFETTWGGADSAGLPEPSGCGTPSGSAADHFATDKTGGKIEACHDKCSTRQGECVKRCDERYPRSKAPSTTKTVPDKLSESSLTLRGSDAFVMKLVPPPPPPPPDPNAVAFAQCVASCTTSFQACSRTCAAQP